MELPRHHHTGTVIVYTLAGAWRYKEHDWIATPGTLVFETAASAHTPLAVEGQGDVVTLNILVGELLYTDDAGNVIASENWRSEEHTSELQSLMRISYAVFCLKKKKST